MSPSRAQSRGGGGKNPLTKCHFPSPSLTLGFDLSGARDKAANIMSLCQALLNDNIEYQYVTPFSFG